ncbi:hypothetical protein PRZ48_012893 [Zasmidium cellare]|uniref:Uncharacterized protein n=1 Tax=Zasmidium cellare TaxID=395010 RepID=A0ABR0E2W1_ZASCE|nr:hypothetical protein PRZ48_012893 [Zasmidium cellare]
MFPAKAFALALTAWASMPLASAIPRPPFADAPRQRVTAGYGCLMTQDTTDSLAQHHVNIGMAHLSKSCQDAFMNLAAVSILDEWTCRPDSAGLTWIEFTTSARTDVGTIVGAIDLSFPGMRWIQTHECRSHEALEPGYLEDHGVTFGRTLKAYLLSAHGGSAKAGNLIPDCSGSAVDVHQSATEPYGTVGTQSNQPSSIKEALDHFYIWTATKWDKISSAVFTLDFNILAPHGLLTPSTSGPGTSDDSVQVLDQMGGMSEQILARGVENGDHADHGARSVSVDTGSKPISIEHQGIHAPAAAQGQIRPIEPTNHKQKQPKKPSSCHCTDSKVADGTTHTTCKLRIGKAASRDVKCANVEQRLRDKGWVLQHCKTSTWHGMLLTAKRPKTNNQPTTIIQDVQSVFPAWKVDLQCTHISGSPDLPPSDKTQDARYQRPDLLHPPATPPATEERPPLKPSKRGNVVAPTPQTKPLKPTTCKIKDHQNRADVTILIDELYVKERCVTAFEDFRPTTMNVDGFRCEADKTAPTKTKIHYLTAYSKLAEMDERLGMLFDESVFDCARKGGKGKAELPEEEKVGTPMVQKGGIRASALGARDAGNVIDPRSDSEMLVEASAGVMSSERAATLGQPSSPTVLRRDDGDDDDEKDDDNNNESGDDDDNIPKENPPNNNSKGDSPSHSSNSTSTIGTHHSTNNTSPSPSPALDTNTTCTFQTLYAHNAATTSFNLTVPIEASRSEQVCDNVKHSLQSSGFQLKDWNCEPAEDGKYTRVEIEKDGWVYEDVMEGLEMAFRDFDFECTTGGEGERRGD